MSCCHGNWRATSITWHRHGSVLCNQKVWRTGSQLVITKMPPSGKFSCREEMCFLTHTIFLTPSFLFHFPFTLTHINPGLILALLSRFQHPLWAQSSMIGNNCYGISNGSWKKKSGSTDLCLRPITSHQILTPHNLPYLPNGPSLFNVLIYI